jgi:hypothetical protein
MYLFVLLLNAGSALDDARSEVARLRERSDLALSVVRKDWLGKDAASVADLSRQLEQQGVIVGTEGDSFKIGDFIFETKGSLVTRVRYID